MRRVTKAGQRRCRPRSARRSRMASAGSSKKRKCGDKTTGQAIDISQNEASDNHPALNIAQAAVQDSPLGVGNAPGAVELGKAILVEVPEGAQKVTSAAAFNPLSKLQKEKVQAWDADGAAPAFGAAAQPTVLADLRRLAKDSAKASLMFKAPFVAATPTDEALHKAVYGAQCFMIPRGNCRVAPSPYGVNDVHLVTQGEEVIVGVRAQVSHRWCT
eukprot:1275185-Pyramimonas_sp.AAC.1